MYTADIVVRFCVSSCTSLAAPKSSRRTRPSGVIMILDGLTSLWIMFLAWIFSSVFMTGMMIGRVSFMVSLPRCCRYCLRFCPSTNSMMI